MTATASDVLDTYTDLIRRLRNPDHHMADFMAFHMGRFVGERPKRLQYYPVTSTSPDGTFTERQGAEFASFLGASLVGAPVYQVTGDMCAAIDAMFTRTTAEEAPAIYEASLPALAGFVWLDGQLELELDNGPLEPIQVISWSVQDAPTDVGGTMTILRASFWMLVSDTRHDNDARTPASATQIAEIEGWIGPVNLLHTDIYPLNGPLAPAAGVPHRSATALVAYLNMLWMMLQMEITGIDRAVGIRGARRRAQRETGQGDVLVVTLRRARTGKASEPAGEHRDVEWSHRWLVQAHYRHHVAPPRDTWHQAIPAADKKRCTVCSGEVSYVLPYIKGPDGTPLRIRHRVNRLSR
jgi:hypothetical protein